MLDYIPSRFDSVEDVHKHYDKIRKRERNEYILGFVLVFVVPAIVNIFL